MADTRKDKRAPVSLKVRFKSATVDEFIVQYAADISRGGVFIKSKSPMPVGTLLKFEIQLKDESPLIHGVGRVVWKRDASDAAGEAAPSGMGIKFIRMDPECRVLVDKIVQGRGDAPGQFEAGGGDTEEPAPEPAVAAPREVKPRKATMPFFPAAGPTEAELPRPEDRTQVRHASEFLASALAEAGADEAAREAERKAEEARKRQEELERQRIAAAEREAQAAKDAAAKAERERAEREKSEREAAEREKAVASGAAAAAADEAADAAETAPLFAKAPLEASPEPKAEALEAKAAAKTEAEPAAAKAEKKAEKAAEKTEKAAEKKATEKADKKPAAKEPEKRPSKAPAAVVAAPPPAQEPNSYAVPVAIGLAAVLGLGAIVWSQTGGVTETPADPTETAAAPVEGSDDGTGEDPTAAEDGVPEGTEGTEGTEVAEGTEGTEVAEGTEGTPAEGTPAEGTPAEGTPAEGTGTQAAAATGTPTEAAAPMARFRVDSAPAGATISIDGRERGAAPVEVELPVGTAATITARLAGYREGTQQVTPTATQRPVRIALQAMPYVVEVTTTPPGVRVRAGGRTATTAAGAPSRLTLPRPAAAVTVTGSRAGYVEATQTVAPTAFTERDGEMVATVSLTLEERPTPPPTTTRRPPRETTTTEGGAEAGGEAGGGGEAAGGEAGGEAAPREEAAPPPREEAPPPPPREEPPAEAPPDNPF